LRSNGHSHPNRSDSLSTVYYHTRKCIKMRDSRTSQIRTVPIFTLLGETVQSIELRILTLSSTILRPGFINICELVQTLLQYSYKDCYSTATKTVFTFLKDEGNEMCVSRKVQTKCPTRGTVFKDVKAYSSSLPSALDGAAQTNPFTFGIIWSCTD